MDPGRIRDPSVPSTRGPGVEDLADRYRLTELLDDDGETALWRALDLRLGRHVGVRILHPECLADPPSRRAFIAEARALPGLQDLDEESGFAVYELAAARAAVREQEQESWVTPTERPARPSRQAQRAGTDMRLTALAIGVVIVIFGGLALLVSLVGGALGGGTPSATATPAPVVTPTPTPPEPGMVWVPELLLRPIGDARVLVEDAGLHLSIEGEEETDEYPDGTVMRQEPGGGLLVAPDQVLKVWVATSVPMAEVPDITGIPVRRAGSRLRKAGFDLGERKDVWSADIEPGLIISTTPHAGLQVAKGTPVDVVVSKGPKPTPGPGRTPRPKG